MANVLTQIMPKILARSLMVLRSRCSLPQRVNADFSEEAKQKGSTIDIEIPSLVGVSDVTPGPNQPNNVDRTPTTTPLTLNKWRGTDPIHLTDKQMEEVDTSKNFLPPLIEAGVEAIASDINQDIMGKYKKIYGFVGTPGTTPFSSDVTAATDARAALNTQKAPRPNRVFVLNFAAEAKALTRAEFANLEQTGDRDVKIEGEIGRKFGFDFQADDDVLTHIAGAPGGTPLVNGALSIGATSVVLDGGGASGTYKEGDIVTFAGHSQTYVVTADVTLNGSGAGTIVIQPPLKAAVADNAAITLKASHVVNLAMHRDCFAYAMRSLANSSIRNELGGSRQSIMRDPVSGLILRLEVKNQHKQVTWELDALWGAACIRPELGVRVAG